MKPLKNLPLILPSIKRRLADSAALNMTAKSKGLPPKFSSVESWSKKSPKMHQFDLQAPFSGLTPPERLPFVKGGNFCTEFAILWTRRKV